MAEETVANSRKQARTLAPRWRPSRRSPCASRGAQGAAIVSYLKLSAMRRIMLLGASARRYVLQGLRDQLHGQIVHAKASAPHHLKVSPVHANAEISPIPRSLPPQSAASALDRAKLEAADAVPPVRAHFAAA